MRKSARGAALPETALFIGLALMLLLGTSQVAVLGASQLAADGAAFMAAHVNATDPSASAQTVATGAFPQFSSSNVVVTAPTPGIAQAVVSKNVSGLTLFPGAPATYPISGADLELKASSASATPAPFSISFQATLKNYCPASGACVYPSAYTVYIASSPTPGGNGKNGLWTEWLCHDAYLTGMSFPSSRPTPGAGWDPSNVKSGNEYQIYSWDSGTPCS